MRTLLKHLLVLALAAPLMAYAAFLVPQGGTGVQSLTGIPFGNGQSPFTTLTIGGGLTLNGHTLSASGGVSTTSANIWTLLQTFTSGLVSNGAATLATTTISNLNGMIVIDGVHYATTTAGVSSAIHVCSLSNIFFKVCSGVYFPPGDYHFTPGGVVLASNLIYRGAGAQTKLYPLTSDASQPVLDATNASNITISDMYVSRANITPLGTISEANTTGITLRNSSNITVKNMQFEQFQQDIAAVYVTLLSLDHNLDQSGSTTVSGAGVGSKNLISSQGLTDSTITNNTMYGNDTCIRLVGAHRVNVEGNFCNFDSVEINNAEGYGYSSDINIIGNHFPNVLSGAINIIAFSDTAGQTKIQDSYHIAAQNINIVGNTINIATSSNSTGIGGYIETTGTNLTIANVNIVGNTITSVGATSSAVSGITTIVPINDSGYALNWNISNNEIHDISAEGIRLIAGVNSQIKNNSIYRFNLGNGGFSPTKATGIRIEGISSTYKSSNVQVAGNDIDGSNRASSNGLYIGDPAYISSLNVGVNNVVNASTTIAYLSTAPLFSMSTSTGPMAAQYFLASDSNSTSTFAGHVGINTTSAGYPLTVYGGFKPYSLSFSRFSQLLAGTSSMPAMDGNMTVSLYIKPSSTLAAGQSMDALSLSSSLSSANVLSVRWDKDTQSVVFVKNSTIPLAKSADNSVPQDAWAQITATWDGTTNKIYVNGVLASTSITVHSSGVVNQVQVGNINSSNYWFGNISNVRIYNAALNATQIANMYQSYPNTPRSGLVGEWMFQEGSGGSVADTSGTGNTGTITNGNPTWSTDIPLEVQSRSVIADFTAPGNATSSLRSYTSGQLDAGFFNATLSTSTLLGINLTGGCFAINGTCLATPTAYTAAYPVTLSGISFGLAFGTTTTNIWSNPQTFSAGFLALASSTIGSGLQAGGLSISGGATTTLNAYFGSSLGIGAKSPAYKISLGDSSNGSGKSAPTYNTTDQGGIGDFYVMSSSNSERYLDFVSVGGQNGSAGGAGMRFLTNPNTSNTALERLRIAASNGYMGIGTSSPQGILTVQGASSGSGTKGTCFRAKDVGANTFTYWWFKAGVQTIQTFDCGGTGTTTIIYD